MARKIKIFGKTIPLTLFIFLVICSGIGLGALVNYLSNLFSAVVTAESPILFEVDEVTETVKGTPNLCTKSGLVFTCNIRGGDTVIFKLVRENKANNPIPNLVAVGIKGVKRTDLTEILWNYNGSPTEWNQHWHNAEYGSPEMRERASGIIVTEDGWFDAGADDTYNTSDDVARPWHVFVPAGFTQDEFKAAFNAEPKKFYNKWGVLTIPENVTGKPHSDELYPWRTPGTADDVMWVYSEDTVIPELGYAPGDQMVWIEDNYKEDYIRLTFDEAIAPGTYSINFAVIEPGSTLGEIEAVVLQ